MQFFVITFWCLSVLNTSWTRSFSIFLPFTLTLLADLHHAVECLKKITKVGGRAGGVKKYQVETMFVRLMMDSLTDLASDSASAKTCLTKLFSMLNTYMKFILIFNDTWKVRSVGQQTWILIRVYRHLRILEISLARFILLCPRWSQAWGKNNFQKFWSFSWYIPAFLSAIVKYTK